MNKGIPFLYLMKSGPLRLVTLNSTVQFNMHYFLSKAGIKQKKIFLVLVCHIDVPEIIL